MAKWSPFLEGSTPTVYIEGSWEEGERLFAGCFPLLPPGELTESGRILYHVQHHSKLQSLTRDFLSSLFGEVGRAGTKGSSTRASEEAEATYAELLERILVNSLFQDRRIGLVNLFWLSHSKEIAETISKLTTSSEDLARLRFSVHPLLERFYGRVWREACREVDRERPGQLRFALGDAVRSPLVEALIADQLPFTCTEVEAIDFATVLKNNSRFRISYGLYTEIRDLLSQEIERRVNSEDPTFMKMLARHLPTLEPESYALPAHRIKMLFNPDIRRHLLTEPWRINAKLRESERLKREAERGTDPLAVLDSLDELATAVQRFEIVSRLWGRIHLLDSHMSEADIQEEYGTLRIYRFGESVEVTGNAIDATIMFLDLRGFTAASEGLVSERDLTRQLYAVFDPFIEIISRFGGHIDKFLGDGMMVTFGAVHHSRAGPLNALRTAILLQEKIRELRDEGATRFTMGVSIHHGRVYLAHFVGSSGGQDTTVIGRNVNVAGRLSSASIRGRSNVDEGGDREGPGSSSKLRVSIQSGGILFNEGIAVSRETVRAIEEIIPIAPKEELDEVYGELCDEVLKRIMVLRHVGDAKFKGVSGSFPVYSVEYSKESYVGPAVPGKK
jgi:class 3 adenylate cyclase